MNVHTLQIGAVISLFLLCLIKFYIIANPKAWRKSGRIAALWVVIYVFFLFMLRFLQLIGIGTMVQLRLISAIATYIPLLAVCIHLFLFRSSENEMDVAELIEKAHLLLEEAKLTKAQAEITLSKARKAKK